MRLPKFILFLPLLPILVFVTSSRSASAGTAVVTESVDAYNPPLTTAIPTAVGFGDEMGSISPFTYSVNFQDNNVYDTDFYDPEITGNSYDDDTGNFDSTGNYAAFSYYCGHGGGPPGGTSLAACNHNSDCTTPPAGYYGPGTCADYPGVERSTGNYSAKGICRYWWHTNAFLNSTHSQHGNLVWHSERGVAFGESNYSGSWYGAAENGGVNVVVFDQSFGAIPSYTDYTMGGMTAGLHMVAATMPMAGDTTAATSRGYYFALAAASNMNNSVGESWANEISYNASPSNGGGAPCYGQYLPQSDGYGGRGFNGCGCNLIFATDVSGSNAVWRITLESFTDVTDDGYDAQGTGYYSDTYACNYPFAQYPFSTP